MSKQILRIEGSLAGFHRLIAYRPVVIDVARDIGLEYIDGEFTVIEGESKAAAHHALPRLTDDSPTMETLAACGPTQRLTCSSCGDQVPPGARFCIECGAAV